MLYHIVLFDLKVNDHASITQFKSDLELLKKLPGVLEFQLSEDGFTHDISEGDIALFSRFASEKAYQNYMKNPIHEGVKRKTGPLIKQKRIIDFEVAT